MTILDLYVEDASVGHHVYIISRRGEVVEKRKHQPWFAVFTYSKQTAERAREIVNRLRPEITHVEETDRIPYVPRDVSYVPDPNLRVFKLNSSHRSLVRKQAEIVEKKLAIKCGVYNITYTIRASMDLDVKYFSDKTPILFQPNKIVLDETKKIIENVGDIKFLVFDIEVASSGGRFPSPGDPILSITYTTFRMKDYIYDKDWYKHNVVPIIAERIGTRYSNEVVEEFEKVIAREKPDFIATFNGSRFDLPHIRAQERASYKYTPYHIKLDPATVIPHLDTYLVRKNLGSSLKLRSQSVFSLDGVVKSIALDRPDLNWLLNSELMEAEEKMNHVTLTEEYKKGSKLFYNYIVADVYFTAVLVKEWFHTLVILSALTQIPITTLQILNVGQASEYVIVNFLERLGFETPVMFRTKEFRKAIADEIEKIIKELGDESLRLFTLGKVWAKAPGVYYNVAEGDFSQLYPSKMTNDGDDPTAVRYTRKYSRKIGEPRYQEPKDPIVKRRWAREQAFPSLLGRKPSSTATEIVPDEIVWIVPTYGPVSFLIYKMYTMRKITKAIKKEAKETGKHELMAIDQGVKILNNATYGAFSKRRGFINPYISAYTFWKTLKIEYDVLKRAKEFGLTPIYADTDSIFVIADEKAFVEKHLPELNKYIQEKYGKFFEIKYEDHFDEMIIPKSKKSNEPSRKSYICLNGGKVVLFKGEFYKTTTPEYVRDRLAEFYELVLTRKPKTKTEVEELMREFLANAQIHKLFVKKTIDSLISDNTKEEYEQMVINLNRNFHFAALYNAYLLKLPCVKLLSESNLGSFKRIVIEFNVDEFTALGIPIIVHFLPSTTSRDFIIYVGDDGRKAIVHKVKVRSMTILEKKQNNNRIRQYGYTIEFLAKEFIYTKEEIIDMAIKSMRRYILDDIARKLLPVLNKAYGGALDAFFQK